MGCISSATPDPRSEIGDWRGSATARFATATLRDREIADYQLKSPFEVLVKDSEGALIHEKWT